MYNLPYTDFNKVNLDWIMRTLSSIKDSIPMIEGAVTVYQEAIDLVDTVTADVATALATAEGAQTAAEGAQTAAEGAQTAAEGAQTAAEGAQTAAEGAQTAAEGAQTAATQAALDSGTATLAANNANTSAINAASSAAEAAASAAITARGWVRLTTNPSAFVLDTETYASFLIVVYQLYYTGINAVGSFELPSDFLDLVNPYTAAGGFGHLVTASDASTAAKAYVQLAADVVDTTKWTVTNPGGGTNVVVYGKLR